MGKSEHDRDNRDDFIRLPEVVRLSGFSKSMIYLMISRGRFPEPIKIGKRASAWKRRDILKWQRKMERRKEIMKDFVG